MSKISARPSYPNTSNTIISQASFVSSTCTVFIRSIRPPEGNEETITRPLGNSFIQNFTEDDLIYSSRFGEKRWTTSLVLNLFGPKINHSSISPSPRPPPRGSHSIHSPSFQASRGHIPASNSSMQPRPHSSLISTNEPSPTVNQNCPRQLQVLASTCQIS